MHTRQCTMAHNGNSSSRRGNRTGNSSTRTRDVNAQSTHHNAWRGNSSSSSKKGKPIGQSNYKKSGLSSSKEGKIDMQIVWGPALCNKEGSGNKRIYELSP